jgi:hypothetical protein
VQKFGAIFDGLCPRTWNKLGALTHPCNNSGQSSASGARTLALSRIRQDGANVLPRDAREIFEDLIFGHPTGEVLEDIGGGDAGLDERGPRLTSAEAFVLSQAIGSVLRAVVASGC